jgi:peptidyl-prolyl cis-trans isomerase SurA
MTKNQGRLLGFGVACLLLLVLVRPGRTEVVDRIVAVVNDDIITMSELQNMAKSYESQAGTKPTRQEDRNLQRQMLEALIDRKIAKAEAKRRGITVTDKEINQALERFKQRSNIPSDEALAKGLANEGLTLKEFRQQIADQIIQDRLIMVVVKEKAMVSEAEVRRIYEEKFKSGGTRVHLRSIQLPYPAGATEAQKDEIKEKAKTILEEVQRGASFAAAAQKVSVSETDLGEVDQSDLDPRLADHLAKIKPKEVVPIQTPQGLQLLQLVSRGAGEAQSFESVAPEIRQMLMQQKMEQQFMEWVKTLREKAHIKIML